MARRFWQNESYDHVVRDKEEFRRIQRYIDLNPVRAGWWREPRSFGGRAREPPGKAASWQECPPYASAQRFALLGRVGR